MSALGGEGKEPSVARPIPEVADPGYAEHLAGLQRGEVVVLRCADCGTTEWPPRPTCHACHGESFLGHPIETHGTIYTFTVVNRAFHPWFAERVPYAVAIVELADGVRLTGFFEGATESLCCGASVRGEVRDRGGAPAIVWTARVPA